MKNKILLVAVILIVVGGAVALFIQKNEGSEDSSAIAIGSIATIPDWEWVKIINKKPVWQQYANGVKELAAGDTCGVEAGGTIVVLENREDDLVVKYMAPANPMGTPCPSGVEFLVSKTDFATMSAQYEAHYATMQAEKELVKRLLDQNYYGEVVDAGKWQWVDVVNLEPVVQFFSNGYGQLSYGDSCGCGNSVQGDKSDPEGGTLQVRGEANGKVLYEYTARGEPMGTPCPSGILFFVKK